MDTLYYVIGILVLVIVVVPLVNKYARIKNLTIKDWVSVEYFPFIESAAKVSSKTKFGIVVSRDGKIYKTQLELLIKSDKPSAFCNANLYISGIGWFVYRQQFRNISHGRIPLKNDVALRADESHEVNIEFEPKEGWIPVRLQQKKYKCLLIIRLIDTTIKHKFTFQIRSQNIQAMKNFNTGQAQIIEVPIIKN